MLCWAGRIVAAAPRIATEAALSTSEPSASEWDSLLAVRPRAHLLQSFGWGAVQATVGWTPHRLVVVPDGGAPLPVLVLATSSAPGLPPRLYLPRGPACEPADTLAWAAVLAALDTLAGALGAASVMVEPQAWDTETEQVRQALGAAATGQWRRLPPVQPGHTAIVDLSGGEAPVLARMRPKGRYNARLAERRGVEAGPIVDPEEAAATLGALCAATAARQGITQPDAQHIRRVLALLPGAAVHVARVGGEAVSGALVARFGAEAIYLYGGSLEVHRELQPSALLHLDVMRHAIAAGCERYDLWGIPPSADPGHPWHGLRQFKLSLGGVERILAGGFRQVRRPVATRAADLADAGRSTLRRLRHRRP